MKTFQFPPRLCRNIAARAVFCACLLLCAFAGQLVAQSNNNDAAQNSNRSNKDDDIYGYNPDNNARNPNYNNDSRNDGISAGGNWREYDSEDKMTAAKRIQFELVSNNSLRENRDHESQSRVEIYCEDGKYKSAQFVPGVRLAPPNRPGIWGQPQMEVMIRADKSHDSRGWNWDGRYLSMDKGTIREMLGAQVFNVEFLSPRGPQISEFSPANIELGRVQKACGLGPRKP